MSIWRWSKWLPDIPPELRLDIGTGETPLVRSRRIGPAIGLKNLFFKLETNNPTGSYKDRFGAVAISAMLAAGEDRCVATSSGNSGAALAAHCGAAGIRCEIAVIITAPTGKLLQMRAYGADIYRIDNFRDR
jgi:threonine synthase